MKTSQQAKNELKSSNTFMPSHQVNRNLRQQVPSDFRATLTSAYVNITNSKPLKAFLITLILNLRKCQLEIYSAKTQTISFNACLLPDCKVSNIVKPFTHPSNSAFQLHSIVNYYC